MNSSFGFDGPGLTPGLGPGNAHNHAETMQRLERLNHLETVTAEQRIRIEKYKTMYETLKAESEQLEDVSFHLVDIFDIAYVYQMIRGSL